MEESRRECYLRVRVTRGDAEMWRLRDGESCDDVG